MSRAIKLNTAMTAIGMVFFQITNFLLAVFIVRAIGAQELGNYQLFVATATLLSYLAKLGLDEKLSYMLPTLNGAKSAKGQAVISQAFIQAFIAAFFVLVVFVVISAEALDSKTLIAYMFYFPSFVLTLVAVGILRAEQKVILRNVVLYVLPNLLNVLFLLIISHWLFTESSSLLARAFTYFLLALYLLYFVKKHYSVSFGSVKSSQFSIEFGWLIMTTGAFAIESGVVALWYSKLYLSEVEFGVFAILMRLAALVVLVPIALTIVMGPVFAKSPQNISLQRKTILFNTIGVVAAIAFLIITSQYWLNFFGSEYVQYQSLLSSLIFVMGFYAMTQPMSSVLIANNKKDWLTYSSLVVLAFLVGMLYFTATDLFHVIESFEYAMMTYSIVRIVLYSLYLNHVRRKTLIGQN